MRPAQIDRRLQEIADGAAERLVERCWRVHHGQWCRGVSWDRYTLQQLLEISRCACALIIKSPRRPDRRACVRPACGPPCACVGVRRRCVGGLGLSVVCRMLAEDYNGWRGGMPDLLLWRPEPGRGDAKLVEVKGPRDRLSDAQRAWIVALTAVGVPCEVLRVQEPK